VWEIDISNEVKKDISKYYFVIGNKYTTSDNLYFIGGVNEISSNVIDDTNYGFKSLKDDYKSYVDLSVQSEIIDLEN
jgi:hypothetical protein